MAWDWIEKGTKRLQELGGEYKQHHALVERLLMLDPAVARDELLRRWPSMDDRMRAGMKMTVAGLTLSQQAALATAEAKIRGERLKGLHAAIEQMGRAAAAGGETAFTTSAARVTQKLAGVAERARPKAEELFESARRGIERHGPVVEAAVKNAISDLLKADIPGAKRNAPADGGARAEPSAGTPPTSAPPDSSPGDQKPGAVRDDRVRPAASTYAGAATITGQWIGTLRQPGSTETRGCDLHVAASGRPIWAFNDTDGFHKTELTHAGQKVQYVPPERGVVTVLVHSVTGSPGETGYVVDYTFERSSNGHLTQRYQRIAMAGQLRGAQLDVTYSEQGISSFGDNTGLAAGGDAREYRGSLTKQA